LETQGMWTYRMLTVGSQYKMEMLVDVSNYHVTPSKEVMQALE